MLRSTALSLLAALLLAAAGCTFDDMEAGPHGPPPPFADTFDPPPPVHEVHRMFDAEKRNAVVVDLPSQF